MFKNRKWRIQRKNNQNAKYTKWKKEEIKGESESESYTIPKSTITVLKWGLSGCGTLLAIVLGIGGWMATQLYDLNSKALTEDSKFISSITDSVNNVAEDVKKIDNGLNGAQGMYARLAIVEEKLNTPIITAATDTQRFASTASLVRNDINISKSSISSDACIGTDSDGNVYIAKDLIDETILLTYVEDDKELYFLGQYNENYHWNGYCVTNAYNSDGTLYGICESNFDDGKRLDYKSFCVSESNDKEWIYSDKICNENNNSGTNILCSFDYGKKKNFTNTNVRITDIIYVDSFVESINPTVLTYYCGNTSDGKYNDDTGNAYEIIYNDDGTIKTLYVGNFKDGTFNDDTGKAWDIAYSSEGGYYVYNKGEFKDGRAVNRSTTQITIDRINEIISEHEQKFDVELKWKQN